MHTYVNAYNDVRCYRTIDRHNKLIDLVSHSFKARWLICGVGSKCMLRGPPIQVVGVALIVCTIILL